MYVLNYVPILCALIHPLCFLTVVSLYTGISIPFVRYQVNSVLGMYNERQHCDPQQAQRWRRRCGLNSLPGEILTGKDKFCNTCTQFYRNKEERYPNKIKGVRDVFPEKAPKFRHKEKELSSKRESTSRHAKQRAQAQEGKDRQLRLGCEKLVWPQERPLLAVVGQGSLFMMAMGTKFRFLLQPIEVKGRF